MVRVLKYIYRTKQGKEYGKDNECLLNFLNDSQGSHSNFPDQTLKKWMVIENSEAFCIYVHVQFHSNRRFYSSKTT